MIFISGFARTGTSILFKCLQNSGFNGGDNLFGHKYKTQDKRLNSTRTNIDDGNLSLEEHDNYINEFFNYCAINKIEILKDPHLWTVFKAFYEHSQEFRESKFIWTMREPLEIVESQVRLQEQHNMPPVELNGKLTVHDMLIIYWNFNKIYRKYCDEVQSLIIDFKGLVYRPKSVQPVISEFIGRPFDISEISSDETYESSGIAQ